MKITYGDLQNKYEYETLLFLGYLKNKEAIKECKFELSSSLILLLKKRSIVIALKKELDVN